MNTRSIRSWVAAKILGGDELFYASPKAMLRTLADAPADQFNRLASDLGQKAEAMKPQHLAASGGNAALGLIGGTIVAVAFNPLAGLALASAGCVMGARQIAKFLGAAYHSKLAYGLRDEALRANDVEPVREIIRQAISSDDAYNDLMFRCLKGFDRPVQSGEIMKP